MEVLRERRTWYLLGLLAAVAVALALYLVPPRPTFLGLLVDLAGLAVTFLGGLAIISQFVLPVQTQQERMRVFQHFLNYVFGSHGPLIFVKDGQLVAGAREVELAGQGVALLDASSAIVLERAASAQPTVSGTPLVRAAGPGVVFIAPGERIVATLDLRRQSRGMLARALTRDGIEISAYVGVTFSLDPNLGAPDQTGQVEVVRYGPTERNKPAYPFNPVSAFRAVYGTALGEKQPVPWTDLPLAIAVECFRDQLAEYTLDELFRPTVNEVYPFTEFQGQVAAAIKKVTVLRERGVLVHNVAVGTPKLPREVINQRIRSWQARWHKAAIQQVAAGNSQAIKTANRWKARAQEEIIRDWQRMLANTSDQFEKKALALVLTKVLQRAASEPRTKQMLPPDTLRMLDALPDWVNKNE